MVPVRCHAHMMHIMVCLCSPDLKSGGGVPPPHQSICKWLNSKCRNARSSGKVTKPSGRGGGPWRWLVIAVHRVFNCHSCSMMFYDMRIKAWKQVHLLIHTSSFPWPCKEYLHISKHISMALILMALILIAIIMPTLITMAKVDCILMACSRPHKHCLQLLLLMLNIQHKLQVRKQSQARVARLQQEDHVNPLGRVTCQVPKTGVCRISLHLLTMWREMFPLEWMCGSRLKGYTTKTMQFQTTNKSAHGTTCRINGIRWCNTAMNEHHTTLTYCSYRL